MKSAAVQWRELKRFERGGLSSLGEQIAYGLHAGPFRLVARDRLVAGDLIAGINGGKLADVEFLCR